MQTFKDTTTGLYWQFDDADDVRLINGVYQVFDVKGNRILSVPETLEPAELPELEPPTVEELRQAKLDAVTAKRWDVMTGGLTLPSGVVVGTDVDDQNRITSVVANASLAGLTDADTVDFKAASGWVSLTIGEIKAVAGVIGQFVQACFSSERTHHEAVGLLETAEDITNYPIEQGWPDTDLRPEPDPEEPEEPEEPEDPEVPEQPE